MKKSLLLLSAIILGILFPQASVLSFLVYYLLMIMLFFPFLKWKISISIFYEKKIYLVLMYNIIIGLFGYYILLPFNHDLALIAFLIGITPTATACPAVMGFLKGKVDFAIAAVIVTNIFMSFFLPFMIYNISDRHIEIYSILIQTLIVIFIPLLLSQATKCWFPKTSAFLVKLNSIGFYSWVVVCFLAVAKASAFIQSNEAGFAEVLLIAGISGVICFLNFSIGKMLGGENLSLETSQTLGQKNTTMTIWIGLTFFDPIIALGPIFYLIYHNLYNSYQLAVQEKKKSYVSGKSTGEMAFKDFHQALDEPPVRYRCINLDPPQTRPSGYATSGLSHEHITVYRGDEPKKVDAHTQIICSINHDYIGDIYFDKQQINIGKNPRADIILVSDSIADINATLFFLNGEMILTNNYLDNSLRLNGNCVESAHVSSNDTIGLGPFSMRIKLLDTDEEMTPI